YDPADAAGNKLKSFCWPGTGGAACADGPGLNTANENTWFNPSPAAVPPQPPSGLVALNTWGPAQSAAPTARNLLDYLRAHTSNEDTNQGLATDLYRNRLSRLGDLVNPHPAYARKATFNYTRP